MRIGTKIILFIFRVAVVVALVWFYLQGQEQTHRLRLQQNQLEDLQARLARTTQQIASQPKQPSFSFQLAQVRFDLMSAQQWLLLGRDPNTAQHLLDQADHLAMVMPGADWFALRQALAEDERDLAHVGPVDQVGDELKISALRTEMMGLHRPQLPLPVKSAVEASPISRTMAPIQGWKVAVYEGIQALKQLVQIHPVVDPHELVPDAHDFVILQQHLLSLLDSVGWGVRYGQPRVVSAAFQELFQQLNSYASWLRPDERANLLHDLGSLQNQLLDQPAAPPPSLDRSMKVLMRLQQEETGS